MKTITFLSVIFGLLVANLPSMRGETLDWSQLPSVVQRVINDQRGPVGIVSIDRVDRFGAPVYEVQLNGPGPNNRFAVTETGNLVKIDDLISRPGLGVSRDVTFGSLPISVQNTIRSRVGNAPIHSIEMLTANGQTSYVVPFRLGDEIVDLWVDPNGNVLTTSPSRVLLSSPHRIAFEDLPSAVRDSLRIYAGGTPIASVQKGKLHGRTVYETTLNPDGRKIALRMAENGALIRDSVNDRFLAETGRLFAPGNVVAAKIPTRVPLADRASVSFNQLPAAVISTIQKYAGTDLVEKIEKGIAMGQSVYQAVFRHAAETIPLRIAEDGSIINDDVNNWSLTRLGQSPILPASDWRVAPPRATLSDVRRVNFDQLPPAVQATLRYYAGGVPLQDLVLGTSNGEPVYQADVKWHGEDTQLRISEDGSLLDDRVNARFLTRFVEVEGPAAVGQAPGSQSNRGGGSSLIRP